jgi:hypothetical protein
MKILISIFCFFLVFRIQASDYSFIIKGNRVIPQMDYQLELILEPSSENSKMILDCQSFVNGLNLLEYFEDKWSQKWFYMLSGNDCEDAALFSIKSQEENKPYCLILNFDEYNLDLSHDLKKCY